MNGLGDIRLYEAIGNMRDKADELEVERDQLADENAKLRELVLYMWDFSCVVPDEPYTFKEELDYSVEVWKRMRELGVEVDE